MNIKLAIGLNNKDNFLKDTVQPWVELVKRLSLYDNQVIKKDNALCFIAGHFMGKQRLTENLVCRSMITLDLDNYDNDLTHLEDDLRASLSSYVWFAYSTASHSLNKPRVRILIPFGKEVNPGAYKNISTNFINTLPFKDSIDIKASTAPNYLMYFPIKSREDYIPWYMSNEGEFLNPDQFNLTVPNVKLDQDNFHLLYKNKPLDISTRLVKEHLDLYPANKTDYHGWLEVGMALHHQYEGKEEGLAIFLEWSKKDQRYNQERIKEETKMKWKSFSELSNQPLTFATIIQKVKTSITNKNQHSDKAVTKCNQLKEVPKVLWVKVNKQLNPLNTLENFEVLLDFYGIFISYDVITKNVNVKFDGKKLTYDDGIINIKSLCINNGMKYDLVSRYLDYYKKKNLSNSWKEWVESKPHDGISRFKQLCETLEVNKEHEEIRDLYLKKWLIQLLHVTCLNDDEEPKQARMVFVLQGGESIGKSTWFRRLAPKYVGEVKALNVSDDMEVLACIKHVIIEFAEINATINKSNSESLKNFISRTKDIINEKYIATPQEYRRRTVFGGSVNNARFLSDDNENTRFLVVPVLNCNAFHNIDMQQLYAEIYEEAKLISDYNLTKEERETQKSLNIDFASISNLKEKFYEIFDIESQDRSNFYTATQVLEKLGYQLPQIKKNHTNEMAKILDDSRLERKHTRSGSGWLLPPLRQQMFDDIL